MNSKLKVFKYSPVTYIYIGYEDALPHPITGNFQIPSYTTKLVPPNKRVGYDVVFKEKEGSLPGLGIGEWTLIKQEEITYYHKETLQPIKVLKVNEPTINKNIYTNISPYDNEYKIYPVKEAFDFKDNKWVLDIDKLKNHITDLLKTTRSKCLGKSIVLDNIEFDTDEKSQKNIQKHSISFGLNISTKDIFGKEIGIELSDLRNKCKILPWIDKNNEVQLIAPMTLIRLNYIISFRELLVYSLYNKLREKISECKTLANIKKVLNNLDKDLESNIITEMDNIDFTADYILNNTLGLLSDIK